MHAAAQFDQLDLLVGQGVVQCLNRIGLVSLFGLQTLELGSRNIPVLCHNCTHDVGARSVHAGGKSATRRESHAMARNSSRPVYSTAHGRLCPACREPVASCRCRSSRAGARPATDGIVRLHRESKGRGGKAVTIIRGLPLDGSELKALAKTLKQRCGVGGAVKDGTVEIQGDQRETLKKLLLEKGYEVRIAGG